MASTDRRRSVTISWRLVIAGFLSGLIAGACGVGRLDLILITAPLVTLAAWLDES